jgi:hypothetical protein
MAFVIRYRGVSQERVVERLQPCDEVPTWLQLRDHGRAFGGNSKLSLRSTRTSTKIRHLNVLLQSNCGRIQVIMLSIDMVSNFFDTERTCLAMPAGQGMTRHNSPSRSMSLKASVVCCL